MKPAAWTKTQPSMPVSCERASSRTPRHLHDKRVSQRLRARTRGTAHSYGPHLKAETADSRLGEGLPALERLGRDGDSLDAPLRVGLLVLGVEGVEGELVGGNLEVLLEVVEVFLRDGERQWEAQNEGKGRLLPSTAQIRQR